MRQWKNFENRSIFDKDMDKTLWLTFLGHPVYTTHNITTDHLLLIFLATNRCQVCQFFHHVLADRTKYGFAYATGLRLSVVCQSYVVCLYGIY